LEDQYRIFRYGNDHIRTSYDGAGRSNSRAGAAAIPFLVAQLGSKPNEITVHDTLEIFLEVALTKSYDVKPDAALMATLTSVVAGMKDQGWRDSCLKLIRYIKE
jgi:hypothetical protein